MKKINWSVVGYLPIFIAFAIGVAYLGRWMFVSPPKVPPNFALLFIAGLILWWTGWIGVHVHLVSGTNLSRELSWWKVLLSVLGGFATFIAFFLGFYVPVAFEAFVASAFPGADERATLMFQIGLWATAYYTFCLLAFWIRYRVAKGTVVILDGKILYPGSRYTLYPWFSYQVDLLRETLRLKVDHKIPASGTVLYLNLETEIGFGIEEAREKGIDALDPRRLIKQTKEAFTNILLGQIATVSFREIHEKGYAQFSPFHPAIEGFPVHWDGKVKVKITDGPDRL